MSSAGQSFRAPRFACDTQEICKQPQHIQYFSRAPISACWWVYLAHGSAECADDDHIIHSGCSPLIRCRISSQACLCLSSQSTCVCCCAAFFHNPKYKQLKPCSRDKTAAMQACYDCCGVNRICYLHRSFLRSRDNLQVTFSTFQNRRVAQSMYARYTGPSPYRSEML